MRFLDQLEAFFETVGHWLRTDGIRIAIVIVGAVLLHRAVHWGAGLVRARLDREQRAEAEASLVPSEQTKYRQSVAQSVAWALIVLIWISAAGWVFRIMRIDLTGVIVPASIAGVALGFGAQQIVGDLLSGFFILTEHQYGIGDIIRVSSPGETEGVLGTVEDITLRSTVIRTVGGEAIIIPNGSIRQVANLSKEWSRVVVDVPLASEQNIKVVERELSKVCHEIFDDDDWVDLLLEEPQIQGVDSMDVGRTVIQVIAKTLPAQQFDVGRELRRRIRLAFNESGIKLAKPIGMPETTST